MTKPQQPNVADADPFADLTRSATPPEPTPEPLAKTVPPRKGKHARARPRGVSQGFYAGKRAVTGYLDENAYARLVIFKETLGFSIAGMLEEAIDDYIQKIRANEAYRKLLDPNS
jgi:hypothetical protein